jgi:hypothetical protein
MTYYSKFDVSIQCEESMEVSPEEQAEIFQMMAEEHAAFEASGQWSESLEVAEPEEEKDWLNGYSNHKPGKTYNGLDV